MSTTITRHPEAATLVSFAAGTLAEPLAAVVASHAAMCRQCRAELVDLDLFGAALLLGQPGAAGRDQDIVPVTLATDRMATVGNGRSRDRFSRAVDAAERLPGPIALAYNLSFATVPWKRLGPGVWHHRLFLSEGTEGDLRLLKIGPGRQMPDHGHGGDELTLILDGSFSDVTGEYHCGDLQDVDEGVEHKPLTDKVTGCVCLIASERPARFKSVIGRLILPLTGM